MPWPGAQAGPELVAPPEEGTFLSPCAGLLFSPGVGIFSFARYGADFHSSHFKGQVKQLERKSSSDYSVFDDYDLPEAISVLLLRSCKVRGSRGAAAAAFRRWESFDGIRPQS